MFESSAGSTAVPRRSALWLAPLTVVLVLLLGLVAPVRWVFLGSELLIAILYASSLNLLMGYGGMLSFGHSAYYSLGAYAAGLLFVRLNWGMGEAMVAGPLVAAAGAALFGLFIIRGHRGGEAAFLMLTLAFSQLVFAIIYKWYEVTRGDDGVSGIDAQGVLSEPRNYFVFVLAVVSGCLWLLWRIKRSPFGMTLQSIRDNSERAQFNGVAIQHYRLGAFVLAGAFAGVAGVLYAFFSGTISPQMADWTASARPFLANTIGGVQSFWGPILGVLAIELVDSQTARWTEHSILAVGLFAIGVGLFLPRGLMGAVEQMLLALRRKSAQTRRDG